ncbi:MAG: serine hydrolase domain-containing protein [Leucothrix sp.]
MKNKTKKLSVERLGNVEKLLDQYVNDGKIAGYNCLVSQHLEEVAYFQNGMKDEERANPIDRNTLFRIYSMTKPLTSVAMMQLFEQGLFLLDDPVHHYIPEWRNLKVFKSGDADNYEVCDPERPMTIRDLFLHTAGLTYGFQESHAVDEIYRRKGITSQGSNETLGDMAAKLVDVPLLFSPGSQWNYSIATDVLGYLVEIISGQSLDAYLQEHILTPLGMSDTSFSVKPGQEKRFSACYLYLPSKTEGSKQFRLEDDPRYSRYLETPALLSGGGGLVSSIDDYYAFCKMLLNKGELNGVRILGSKTIEFMARNHLPLDKDLAGMGQPRFSETNYAGVGFGLGFSVIMNAAQSGVLCSEGEIAWGGMASTSFWVDPVEEIIVVFMTQLIPSSCYPIRSQLHATVYQALV